jgi:hypothetical protein
MPCRVAAEARIPWVQNLNTYQPHLDSNTHGLTNGDCSNRWNLHLLEIMWNMQFWKDEPSTPLCKCWNLAGSPIRLLRRQLGMLSVIVIGFNSQLKASDTEWLMGTGSHVMNWVQSLEFSDMIPSSQKIHLLPWDTHAQIYKCCEQRKIQTSHVSPFIGLFKSVLKELYHDR